MIASKSCISSHFCSIHKRAKNIHKSKASRERKFARRAFTTKAKKAREKTLSVQFEVKRANNKAIGERKFARREERLAQGPGEKVAKSAASTPASAPTSQATQGTKKTKK